MGETNGFAMQIKSYRVAKKRRNNWFAKVIPISFGFLKDCIKLTLVNFQPSTDHRTLSKGRIANNWCDFCGNYLAYLTLMAALGYPVQARVNTWPHQAGPQLALTAYLPEPTRTSTQCAEPKSRATWRHFHWLFFLAAHFPLWGRHSVISQLLQCE